MDLTDVIATIGREAAIFARETIAGVLPQIEAAARQAERERLLHEIKHMPNPALSVSPRAGFEQARAAASASSKGEPM